MKKILILLLLVLFLVGCGSESVDITGSTVIDNVEEEEVVEEIRNPQTHLIEVKYPYFRPHYLEISKGDRVNWINKDDRTHRVVEDSGLFDSKDFEKQRIFGYVFDKEGVYRYHCSKYPSMKGVLVVG